jgi:hypothetical protein
MADRERPLDNRPTGGGMASGRGYGRDFGEGRGQGFDGGHGEGYGGSVGPTDYREGFGGEAYGGGMQAADYERSFGGRGEDFGGDDRGWIDQRADQASQGPHRGRGPRGWSRRDERIREEVCERLLQDRLLDARGVEVQVQDGVVTLAGEVPGGSDAAHAEMLARQAPGVVEVRCNLVHAPGRREIDRSHPEEAQGQRTRWGRWVPPLAT